MLEKIYQSLTQKATKRNILIFFSLQMLLLLLFNTVIEPNFETYSQGFKTPDLGGFYSPDFIQEVFAHTSPEGWQYYRTRFAVLDFFYPTICALSSIFILIYTFKRGLRKKNKWRGERLKWLILIPIFAALVDYVENFSILYLTTTTPNISNSIAQLLSVMTASKIIGVSISIILIFIGIMLLIWRHIKTSNFIPRVLGAAINVMVFFFPKRCGTLALDIFCTPRGGKINSAHQAFLDTASTSSFLSSTLGAMKTYTWNEQGSRSVLLFHGWESNSARWRFLIPHLLQENIKVIAVDAPAHGASEGNYFDMPRYANIVNLAIQNFQPDFVIGHSLGGSTFTFYLTEYEATVIQKMVLMGVPSELSHLMSKYTDVLGFSNRTIRALYQVFEEKFSRPVTSISTIEFCQSITIPTLVIHDKSDDVAMVEDSFLYHEQLLHSKLFITEQLGHSLQDEVVYTEIISFLNGVEG